MPTRHQKKFSTNQQKMANKNSQNTGQITDLLSDTEEQKNDVPNGKLQAKQKKCLCIETKDKEGWLTLENLTILFAVLTVVFSVATVVIVGVKISDGPGKEQEHAKGEDPFFDPGPVCVTCSKLLNTQNGQANPRLDKLTKKFKSNVQMCCAEDWKQLSVMMSVAIPEIVRQTIQSVDSLFKFSPVSAHKSLVVGDWKKGEASFFTRPRPAKLNQTYNDPVTEHVRGLEIAEDGFGFVIPYSGVYYVYASLLFKPITTKPFKELTYKELYGYIYRQSPNTPGHSGYYIKMCHSLPLCDDCKDDQETVFSGGVFNLLAGDKMQVRVTGPGLVEFKKESSYFGLVMLASENRASG